MEHDSLKFSPQRIHCTNWAIEQVRTFYSLYCIHGASHASYRCGWFMAVSWRRSSHARHVVILHSDVNSLTQFVCLPQTQSSGTRVSLNSQITASAMLLRFKKRWTRHLVSPILCQVSWKSVRRYKRWEGWWRRKRHSFPWQTKIPLNIT